MSFFITAYSGISQAVTCNIQLLSVNFGDATVPAGPSAGQAGLAYMSDDDVSSLRRSEIVHGVYNVSGPGYVFEASSNFPDANSDYTFAFAQAFENGPGTGFGFGAELQLLRPEASHAVFKAIPLNQVSGASIQGNGLNPINFIGIDDVASIGLMAGPILSHRIEKQAPLINVYNDVDRRWCHASVSAGKIVDIGVMQLNRNAVALTLGTVSGLFSPILYSDPNPLSMAGISFSFREIPYIKITTASPVLDFGTVSDAEIASLPLTIELTTNASNSDVTLDFTVIHVVGEALVSIDGNDASSTYTELVRTSGSKDDITTLSWPISIQSANQFIGAYSGLLNITATLL